LLHLHVEIHGLLHGVYVLLQPHDVVEVLHAPSDVMSFLIIHSVEPLFYSQECAS
jgi:hypothetical protein